MGITKIELEKSAVACSSTTSELQLYQWPGSVKGYKNGNVWATGTSSAAGATAVPKMSSFKVNKWRNGYRFCATRMTSTSMKLKAAGTACAAPHFACSECECVQGTTATPATAKSCPYSTYVLRTAALKPTAAGTAVCSATKNTIQVGAAASATNDFNAYCTWGTIAKASYLVDFDVELFGTPCKDPNEHPTTTNVPWMNVINDFTSPCNINLFGSDTTYTTAVDEISLKAFAAANPGSTNGFSATTMGSALFTAFSTDAVRQAKLFGRYKIETGCGSDC